MPLTLAIRLAANIIAGHLLLTLLGGQGNLFVMPDKLKRGYQMLKTG